MLSLIAATMLLSAQPAGASMPLVVNLCNTTPTRVAYSVVYPSGTRSERRRGWLSVEPGDCLYGAIGDTTGGRVWVHAMSGEFRWPSGSGERSTCVPANSHDDLIKEPPCWSNEREAGFDSVRLSRLQGRYELNHSVGCGDLSGPMRDFCQRGRLARDGFAEPVRSLEVCNFSSGPIEVAAAGQALEGAGRQVTGWTAIEGEGQCADVWSGYFLDPVVHIHIRGNVPFEGGIERRRICLPIEGDFDFIAETQSSVECRPDQEATTFRGVRFDANVSRMSFDIGN